MTLNNNLEVEHEPIKNKEEKSIAILVKYSLEFLTAFEIELRHNPKISIEDFHHKFSDYMNKGESRAPYPLINQGVLIAHLYGMIVYPKETLRDELPTDKLLKELSRDVWGNFEVLSLPNRGEFKDKDENEWTFDFFIKKMRNSISHGRVNVDSDMNFTFEDMDGTKIKFDIHELIKFTYQLYGTYLDDWKFVD